MQSQTKKSTRGFVVAITLPFPPRPTILGSASSTSTKPLKYILYHPHFLTFTFCRICINALKKGELFLKLQFLFFSQKIASQHLPLFITPLLFSVVHSKSKIYWIALLIYIIMDAKTHTFKSIQNWLKRDRIYTRSTKIQRTNSPYCRL